MMVTDGRDRRRLDSAGNRNENRTTQTTTSWRRGRTVSNVSPVALMIVAVALTMLRASAPAAAPTPRTLVVSDRLVGCLS
jgi:hypothetical protein